MATQDLFNELKTLRDEIRVKRHLAGMDARDAWKDIEGSIDKLAQHTDQEANKLIDKVRAFGKSLGEDRT